MNYCVSQFVMWRSRARPEWKYSVLKRPTEVFREYMYANIRVKIKEHMNWKKPVSCSDILENLFIRPSIFQPHSALASQSSSVHLSFDPTRDHNVDSSVLVVMTKNWNSQSMWIVGYCFLPRVVMYPCLCMHHTWCGLSMVSSSTFRNSTVSAKTSS